ncbi:Nucleolar protein 6 [Boothiomyces sp. JEL0866]|nr:Nucleolar protein 6 [Boothiomyces sp. JEL0866]
MAKKEKKKFEEPEDYHDDDMIDEEIDDDEEIEDDGDMIDDEQDFSEEDLDDEEQSKKKVKIDEKSLYRPPTNNEMQNLKQTTEMFKSNLFKLQIEELIKQVEFNPHKNNAIQNGLHEIKDILDGMPDIEPKSATQIISAMKKSGIEIPVVPPKDTLLKFPFKKPENISIVGSFLLQTMTKKKQNVNVDIAVTMPDSLFLEKDHVNNRYFYKRAYYLAVIASTLKSKGYDLEFHSFQNDVKRPILIVKSTGNSYLIADKLKNHYSKRKVEFRIFPVISSELFSKSKLAPLRNNVRPQSDQSDLLATPHYNASLLQDTEMGSHLNFIHSSLKDAPALKQAIILSKVWITQRGLSENHKNGFGLSGFLISMIMAALLKSSGKNGAKRIGKGFSSYQMVKVTLDLLAKHDFSTSPLFLSDNFEPIGKEEFSAKAFLENYDIAIVDPTGTINLASHITKSAMDEIQYEAKLTLEFFNDASSDRFEDLFLKNVDQPWLKYDNIFRIPKLPKSISSYALKDSLDFSDKTSFALRQIYQILKHGLNRRVLCISVSCPKIENWKINKSGPTGADSTNITIGMILHPEHSIKEVEQGPSGDDKEAVKEFKKIWGGKSELRRYKDGSILESVVFSSDGSIQSRALLVARMTAYLLDYHFSVGEEDGVTYWAGLGNKYLNPKSSEKPTNSYQGVMDAYQDLIKELKTIDLKLAIHRLHPLTDSLTYSSVFVPQPDDPTAIISRSNPPEFLIEFETSGKWPDDISAIETMKRAFYIKIATAFAEKDSETVGTVCVGLNNESYLQIVHSSGYLFKVRIYVGRIIYLLENIVKVAPPHKKPALALYKQNYTTSSINRPIHASLIGNLCLRFPFLGFTIRLAKRWLASQMLLSKYESGIAPEVIELICVRIYTHPTAFGPPASGWVGFVRFLELISTFKWSSEPFIVELENEKLNTEIREEINSKFNKISSGGVGHISMFVATELDHSSSWWNTLDISTKVVQKLTILAKSSLELIKQVLTSGNTNDISPLFVHPTHGYHAIIHLNTHRLPDFHLSVNYDPSCAPVKKSKFKNVMDPHDKKLIEQSYIDVQSRYLDELVEYFGDIALFFTDIYGGDKICVVWKPGRLEDTHFKANLTFNSKLVQAKKEKPLVTVNKEAILAEMQRLGKEIVAGIQGRLSRQFFKIKFAFENCFQKMLSTFEDKNLPELFKAAVQQIQELENSQLPSRDEGYQQQVFHTVLLLQEIQARVESLSLFSDNEILEDINTADLKYLLVQSYLGQTLLKINQPRDQILNRAEAFLLKFWDILDSYGIVTPTDKQNFNNYKEDIKPKGDAIRTEKIKQYKREKETKQKLEELNEMLKQELKDETDYERELILTTVDLHVQQAIKTLVEIKDEQEVLKFAEKIKLSDKQDRVVMPEKTVKLADLTGPILDKKGKNKREELAKGVFRPGHNLPTMTIEEYLEREMERGNFLSGGTKQPVKEDPDDNDEEAIDQETYKKREWDNFTDFNPRGWGNRHNKG